VRRCLELALGCATLAVTLLLIVPAAEGSSPTKASWAKAADAICARADAKVRHLPKITTNAIFVSDFKAIVRLDTSLDGSLAAVPAPPAESLTIASLLANDRSQRRLIAEGLVALARGKSSRSSALFKQAEGLGTAYDRIARSLGASVCAISPTPDG
jgi:hypothetical protein